MAHHLVITASLGHLEVVPCSFQSSIPCSNVICKPIFLFLAVQNRATSYRQICKTTSDKQIQITIYKDMYYINTSPRECGLRIRFATQGKLRQQQIDTSPKTRSTSFLNETMGTVFMQVMNPHRGYIQKIPNDW